ncbi:hypothetical protein D1B31_17705 [Neobacillus notoginsengisoli]|uniref:Uncharacterized protein n=1 Tax=Neobacillus notoginsengisoli TaxID=1578198 RepID=A0A417YQQ2_9BACI|nr:hypothetical protein [Neobacillus notoginsengisoli]RHW36550.1 hypothetical protein D1B31_17705 [Neobacillus notoginsengisoli]
MNSLQDTLYNWLTIKVVCDARPDDLAASETKELFEELLVEKYELPVSELTIETEEDMYYVHYERNGEKKKTRFPRELIEVMLNQINLEPEKFANYPNEAEN